MTERAEEANDKPATRKLWSGDREIWAHSRTWKPSKTDLSLSFCLIHPLSLSLSLSLCVFALTRVTQPQRNASYIGDRFKTSGKEKSSKEGTAEGSAAAAGVVWISYARISGQHGRELWQSVAVAHKPRHILTQLLHTCLHKLNRPGTGTRGRARALLPDFSMPLIKIDIAPFQYVL